MLKKKAITNCSLFSVIKLTYHIAEEKVDKIKVFLKCINLSEIYIKNNLPQSSSFILPKERSLRILKIDIISVKEGVYT